MKKYVLMFTVVAAITFYHANHSRHVKGEVSQEKSEESFTDPFKLMRYTVEDGRTLAVSCLYAENGGQKIIATDASGNVVASLFTNNMCYNSMCYSKGEWVPAIVAINDEGDVGWYNIAGDTLRIVEANRIQPF